MSEIHNNYVPKYMLYYLPRDNNPVSIQSTLAYGTSGYGKSTVMVTLRLFGPTFMAIY